MGLTLNYPLPLDDSIHDEAWEWMNIQGVWACLLTSGVALGPSLTQAIVSEFNPCFFCSTLTMPLHHAGKTGPHLWENNKIDKKDGKHTQVTCSWGLEKHICHSNCCLVLHI